MNPLKRIKFLGVFLVLAPNLTLVQIMALVQALEEIAQ